MTAACGCSITTASIAKMTSRPTRSASSASTSASAPRSSSRSSARRSPAPCSALTSASPAGAGPALGDPILGTEIARAVLCHHERVDGRGYPNELHGDEIPQLSRLVQLCDSFVSITDAETYQQPQTQEQALAIINSAAGSQFDEGLAKRFLEMMRT